MTEETKRKISNTLKGRPFSPEHRANLSLAGMGHKPNPRKPESIERARILLRKYQFQPGTTVSLGRKHSDATKKKIGQSNKVALLGHRITDEAKKNMSQARVRYMESHKSCGKSNSETQFLDALERLYNIRIQRNVSIQNRVFDGRYKNIIIEVDGDYWHSLPKSILNDQYKNLLVEESGLTILRIRLNDVKDINQVLTDRKTEFDKSFLSSNLS